jgi:amino acid transporter
MVCHGLMISTGVYLLGTNYVKKEHRTVLKAIPVFAVCVLLAIIMNEIAFAGGLLEREDFNMFYISPHQNPSLPVYSIVQQHVQYPWCLIIYVAAFSLAAYIILLISMLTDKITKKFKKTTKASV